MKRVSKKSIIFISTVIFLLSFCIGAYIGVKPIIDQAKLLSSEEIDELTTEVEEIRETYNIDAVIVTTTDLEEKSPREYADDYYDNNGYGLDEDNSGLLLLIDMGERNIYISTTGKAINYFTDARLDSMIEEIGKHLGNGQYYDACNVYLSQVKHYIDLGIPEDQYNYSEEEHTRNIIFIALGTAAIVALIACIIVSYSYKNSKNISSVSYVDKKSIVFTRRKDTFINTHTTRTKIERDNNSGGSGRSTTHTSSSGSTHGGSGGKF